MLGLRPKLKPRPSFVDLIRTQSIENLNSRQRSLSASNVDLETAQEVALPQSPIKEERKEDDKYLKEPANSHLKKMAPQNSKNAIDGEEQGGSVFSVSG